MHTLSKIAVAVLVSSLVTACHTANTTPTSSLPSGIVLLSDQSQPQAPVAIPHQKYVLANGLTVIIHEDHSDPLVHVDVTYHVGSAREEPGKSGFAHFFEHMMFQGSEHVADEEHFKIITEAGGTMNGTTNSDRTNYFQTVPVNQLEKVLWLEADRMGFLLDAVTEQKFEVQRETVKNERGQRIDNQPYGRLFERVSQALYPDLHPYSWPVIGWMDDLNRANVYDVKEFFLRWYGPNNATLTIGGAVNAADVLPLVAKYFGTIPVGPDVTPQPKQLHTLTADRYISMEDNVHLPLLYMAYPSVYARHPDEAALDILAEILGGGNNSLLYKNLVKNQLTVQANVSHSCAELACTFSLMALPHPASGKNLADIERIIRDSLQEFEQRGVSEDDLLKVKAKIKADSIFGLQSVQGKVSQLAYNETFFGEPDLIASDIARYNAVTKADVQRVYQTYLKGKHAVLMSVVPKGKTNLIARADNFTPTQHDFGGPSKTSAADLQIRRAVDDFDRSKSPVPGVNPPVEVPETWQTSLSNGIAVLGSQSNETPTTSLLLRIPAGLYYETPAEVGKTSLLAAMLNESTKNYSTEAMSLALEKLGSQIYFSADKEFLDVYVASLTEHLPATLALLEEKLLRPAFLSEDLQRLQQQGIQRIQHFEKNPGYVAQQAFNQLMFGEHISRFSSMGTVESLSSITVEQLQQLYQQQIKPQGSQLIVVSDLSQPELTAKLQSVLTTWQGKGPTLQLSASQSAAVAGTIYLIDKPNAPQSEIRIGKRSVPLDISGEFYRAGLMNFVLGGNFNSRINLNLREDKGYTYGAWAGFSGDQFAGVYTASAAVRADATAASVKEFLSEIERFHRVGITADELRFMQRAVSQSDALKYETPQAKLGFMGMILQYNLPRNFVETRQQIVKNMTASEINALAAKHLDPASMSIVIVGDAKRLKPELQTLGLPIVEYRL